MLIRIVNRLSGRTFIATVFAACVSLFAGNASAQGLPGLPGGGFGGEGDTGGAPKAEGEEEPEEEPVLTEPGNYDWPKIHPYVNPDTREGRKRLGLIKTRRGGASFRSEGFHDDDEGGKYFAAFYSMYYYPMMFERKNLRKLPQNRDDLFRKYIYPIKSENDDARTKLMEVSMETLGRYVQNKKVVDRKLVDANYHPVVRYNAMYIIGRLNLREVNRIPGKISPNVPYRGALEFMLRELNNANQIDAVKVAALIGLARHARLDGQQRPENRLPEGHRAAIVKSVLKLLNTKASDEGRSVDGHGWLQRRAIQVLVHLDAGGPEIDQALVRIVGNGKLPLALRCAAADAQGRISNLPSLKDDPVAAAANVGTLALTACSEELRAIKTHLDRLAAAEKEAGAEGETGRPGIRDAAIRPGEAPTNAAAAAPQTDISRRRLYSRLMQLRTSIVGPPEKKPGEVGIYSHVADADGRTKVGAIYKPLAMILSRLQQPPGDLKSLYNDILKPATTLEDEIKKIVPSVAKAPS